ncbi:unnamed protein product [Musa acuminata subsp. malaccensis]|uniref:(wild Malaysian banana) hypothetical protein n=1 Tax=Musa acuminata subsp. malaccensis TaxID=214687 RepID=A0A804I6J0_MUSAM|nr:unnamed protein product [Musa acuminata subsp. malaccensis]
MYKPYLFVFFYQNGDDEWYETSSSTAKIGEPARRSFSSKIGERREKRVLQLTREQESE